MKNKEKIIQEQKQAIEKQKKKQRNLREKPLRIKKP